MSLGSRLEDFHYDLDEHCIAQRPIEPRDAAKLLLVRRHPSGGLPQREEALVRDLPEILASDSKFLKNSLWVRNRSRVFPARFYAKRLTGSVHEIVLLEELSSRRWKAIIKRSSRMKFPEALFLESVPELSITVCSPDTIEFNYERGLLLGYLAKFGEMPLPPYIKQRLPDSDAHRYQSIWAKSGYDDAKSAAAPTASLHFTDEVCQRLESKGVKFVDTCLHVGLGTFEPLRENEVEKNELHSEAFSIPENSFHQLKLNYDLGTKRAPVLCVGTTALRLLESLALDGMSRAESFNYVESSDDYVGRTKVFIKPGFEFRYSDALFTNFHLPSSSLLVLLSCFAGSWSLVRETYQFAQARNFRFFSYGDTSLWL